MPAPKPAAARKSTGAAKKAPAKKAAETVESLDVEFTFRNETQGTRRYQEEFDEAEGAVIGTLYLKKPAAARLGNPESLTLTITPGE